MRRRLMKDYWDNVVDVKPLQLKKYGLLAFGQQGKLFSTKLVLMRRLASMSTVRHYTFAIYTALNSHAMKCVEDKTR